MVNSKMKKIEDYTLDELSAKIEAIKSERERTANALKRYEEELERRKREVPLGVPLDKALANQFRAYALGFASEESACVFDGRIKDYVEALQKLARGEPIDIKALLPLFEKGYVAMYESGVWCWFSGKPKLKYDLWDVESVSWWRHLNACFNIKPADDWRESLQECGI